jgi:hypothetical protein
MGTCTMPVGCNYAVRVYLRRLGLSVAASLAAGLGVWSASAAAQIVPGQGIAGVRIGDSMARVRSWLGAPSPSPSPAHGEWLYSSPQPLGGFVGFRAGTEGHERVTAGVTYVQTSSPTQRTAAGIGPGSSSSQFHHVYRTYRCDHMDGSGSRACWTRTRYGQQTITTAFYFEGGSTVVFVVVASQAYQLRAKLAL